MVNKNRMELFSCTASREFAAKVVDELNKIKYPDEPELHLGASVDRGQTPAAQPRTHLCPASVGQVT